jgi:hypothetical protein
MVIEDIEQCTRKTLVELLGISASHFNTLRLAGVFTQNAAGKYDLKHVIAGWAQYHADGRSGSDMAEEKKRLVIAQRKKIEQDMEERSRELVPLNDAQNAFNETMVLIGAQLDGLAGRVAGEVAGLTDPAEVRGLLFEETRRIRHAAATKLEDWANGPQRSDTSRTATAEDG